MTNEAFFLRCAARSRITTVGGLLQADADGRRGLVLARFDRSGQGDSLQAYAVEDGCQVRGRYPAAKYVGSLEEVLGALVRVCAAPRPAALEFMRQATFAYLTGARFRALGAALGLPERAAARAVAETAQAADGWVDEIDDLPFDPGVNRKLKRVIKHRQRLLLTG